MRNTCFASKTLGVTGRNALTVWEIDSDTNTNGIEEYVNCARNNVYNPFERALIQSQVGMGGRFKA